MAALVEAAGNLVFQLIMNSVRELYLPRADAFTALVVRTGASSPPLYAARRPTRSSDARRRRARRSAIERARRSRRSAMAGG